MIKSIPFICAIMLILMCSCTKVETIITGTVLEFGTGAAVDNASIEVYEITDIQFNSSGTTAVRTLATTLTSDVAGAFNYTTEANFEELEFDFKKDKYVDEFSSDQFKIDGGDNSIINLDMYREGIIRFNIVDDPGINDMNLKMVVNVFSEGNIEHEFTGGDANLLKQVRGDTETEVLVTRNNGFTSTSSIFVAARDTIDFEIKY